MGMMRNQILHDSDPRIISNPRIVFNQGFILREVRMIGGRDCKAIQFLYS
jgi:hypothetical protein